VEVAFTRGPCGCPRAWRTGHATGFRNSESRCEPVDHGDVAGLELVEAAYAEELHGALELALQDLDGAVDGLRGHPP